jgi:hypothetical protein
LYQFGHSDGPICSNERYATSNALFCNIFFLFCIQFFKNINNLKKKKKKKKPEIIADQHKCSKILIVAM